MSLTKYCDAPAKSRIGKNIFALLDANPTPFFCHARNCSFKSLNETSAVFSVVVEGDKIFIHMNEVKFVPRNFIHFKNCGKFKTWLLKLLGGEQ